MVKRTLTALLALFLVATAAPAAASGAQPGTLVSATPTTLYLAPLVPLPAKAWRVVYASRTATGEPVQVSGVVLAPSGAYPGDRPLIGYAPGTQGLDTRCAASRMLSQGTEYEAPFIARMLAKGWAVAVPDYQGLGTPGSHPYVVGEALGRQTLDIVRAARALPGAVLSATGPVGIYGYSEGGEAAGAAIEQQPSYAPDIPLTGAAVGAAPADFQSVIKARDGSVMMFLILYALSGFGTAYPELKVDSYLNATGRDAMAGYRRSCIVDAIATSVPQSHRLSSYVTTNPLEQPAVKARMAENNLGARAPATEVLVGNARNDEVIPFDVMHNLYRQWCGLGVNARFDDIPLLDHFTGLPVFANHAIDFLAQRFAGAPLPRARDCAAA
ncbi:lipase family protein [Amycolatopsis sp. A1MSW2902]|uniref:lipase family protein n=1 Tax=Amycolatopsis sp. A1MSW2902 TaxID=687413 RepID=UPI00307E09B7